eukprot:6280239-Ditylum_brightwellii.AAC.1
MALKEASSYVGHVCKYRDDISKLVNKVELAIIPMPGVRPANSQSMEQHIWEKEVDKYVKRN